MNKTGIVFDLDGTLINSEEGITKCVQYALKAFGIWEPDLEKLKIFIGPPLETMFCEKYGVSKEESLWILEKYRERFDELGIFECHLYDGVKEVLGQFRDQGYFLTLASSKPEIACKRIMEHFHMTELFDCITGATLDGTVSTKQEVLVRLYQRLQTIKPTIQKQELCLVGDTIYDVLGANEFGMDCIGVTYGFGSRHELENAGALVVFDSMEEVEHYFEKNNKRL